ncbi:Complement component C8 gamma chain [Chelonia mydas]|uniref:Complement component C8 gamma chain n=1 Tax=Chelonia mydas TaxID=8469 RepID=M7AUG3_CHEMY|nr:Complement component C8 gamma chain [Chelonia mydas]
MDIVPKRLKFSGKWLLVGVASKCDYLREYNHQLEATTMAVSASEGKSLAVSTFRKLENLEYEEREKTIPGRGSSVDVVVGETDYNSYAILYYQKLRKISIKLYGRSIRVSDAIIGKFEQRITEMNLNEDFTYYFPTYVPVVTGVCVQFTGKWYSIGLASNSRWIKEKKQVLKMCTTVITPAADGNLNVTSTYPKSDRCEKRTSLFIKTDQPGRFSYTSPRECMCLLHPSLPWHAAPWAVPAAESRTVCPVVGQDGQESLDK